ncbi:TolB family protein [Flagellimonas nanhaiensis]|uniref:TolB family protein n=1 Tax=Flagellimonas nanhaiensis TaxID=2292706 RepID=UPI0015F26A26|nr:PD40 domain-containing protein [Allomuricauda nanhaiensis]
MNKLRPLFLLLILIFSACKQTPQIENPEPEALNKGPFFGVAPTEEPQLLAPELLASPVTEYNGTFNPEGTEFYYTTDIPSNAYITYTQMQEDSTWSPSRIASFSGEFSDFDPLFSPDGNRIYFSSSRPKGDNENSKIWYVERQAEGWSKPTRIVLTGEEDNEYYSSLTHNGTIYFNIWSKGDMYKAVPKDSIFEVTLLPEIINTGGEKGDPFIDPNEEYLIFRGYDNSLGKGDLFITYNINGEWTAPENLGEPINSTEHEMCPWVSQDGKLFVFASGRRPESLSAGPTDPIQKVHEVASYNTGQLNLFYMSTDFIQRMKQKHLD